MNRLLQHALTVLLIVPSAMAVAVSQYAITDLGAFGGVSLSPTSVSKSGTVAGVASDGRAFLYSASAGTTFVPPPTGYTHISPTGVNDAGQMIGYFSNGTYGSRRAFVYSAETGIVELASASPEWNSVCDINGSGLVLGYYTDDSSVAHVYSATTGGTITSLGSLGQYDGVCSLSANDSGQILESYCRYTTDGPLGDALISEVFLRSDLQLEDMHAVDEVVTAEPGFTRRILAANDINSLGQVVGMSGYYYTEWGDLGIPLNVIGVNPILYYDRPHAFLYTRGGAPVDLGVLPGYDSYSAALSVNDLGQVVGYSKFSSDPMGDRQTAFLYRDGQMYDLNTLTVGSAQIWKMLEARQINNEGQIIATGYRNGDWQTFLLAPVPEPSALVPLISGFGAVALAVSRRERRRTATCRRSTPDA